MKVSLRFVEQGLYLMETIVLEHRTLKDVQKPYTNNTINIASNWIEVMFIIEEGYQSINL